MKKAIVLSLVFLLIMSSIAAAGIFDSVTGKATDSVLNSPGFFAKLIRWVSASEGEKYSLSAGQSVYMCGHKVGLEFVGAGGAQTIVDGDSKYVNKGASLVIAGVKVNVLDVNAPARTAVLALLCVSPAVETAEEEEAAESEESEEVAEEVTEESEEALALEKCSVSSARFCYLGASADFDEEDVFSCMRTQACAGIEEELKAGGAELALSEISEKDIACYKRCMVDLKCFIKELDVCWHPESYSQIGVLQEQSIGESCMQACKKKYNECLAAGKPANMCAKDNQECKNQCVSEGGFASITPTETRAAGVLKGCTVIDVVSGGKTGNKICSDAGYPLCVNVLQEFTTKYYESKSNTCKDLQYHTRSSTLVACSENIAEPFSDGCYQGKDTPVEALAEPIAGDMTAMRSYQAVCCK